MSSNNAQGYAGDKSGAECLAGLQGQPDAILIDVRTRAEWAYVGIPDLAGLGKEVALVEWQVFPSMTVNPQFLDLARAEIEKRGGTTKSPVYLLCRSGVRSMSAATALTAAGFENCFNVTGGFEGPPDQQRHRGKLSGWKADGLPWVQT